MGGQAVLRDRDPGCMWFRKPFVAADFGSLERMPGIIGTTWAGPYRGSANAAGRVRRLGGAAAPERNLCHPRCHVFLPQV